MSSVIIAGDTSGTITLAAPAAAGSGVLTLPVATDTLVGKATTDTLTNKTLTSPTLTTPALGTPASGALTNCTGLPAGQGASMVLISSATASSSATIDFTGLPANTYSSYRLYVDCAVPATNAVSLLLRTSSSATFQTSGYTWQNWRWTTAGSGVTGQTSTATGIALNAAGADNISNSANNGGSWVIDFYVPSQSTDNHRCNYQGFYLGSANLGVVGNGITGTNTIDGFRFLMDSGNISTGRFFLYGIKNA